MSILPERFSLAVVSALPANERSRRLTELQGLLNATLAGAQGLESYQTVLYCLIEQLSSLGFHLGRWDYDVEVEIWGGPSYMDAQAGDDLLLRSEFPNGVSLAWKDYRTLTP